MHLAADNAKLEVVQFLVSARAEINAKNYKGPGDSETQLNRKSSHGGKKNTKTEAKRRWTMQRSGSSVPTERWSSKSWSRTCLGHWRDFPSQVASICIQPNQFLKDPTHFNRKCLRNEFNLNSTCLTHFLVRCLVQSVILGCCFFVVFPRCIFDFIVFRIRNSAARNSTFFVGRVVL